MYTISLINMPFSDIKMPSIALTQLRSVVQSRFKERVSVQIIYLCHDFAKFLGLDSYDYLSNSIESLNTGFGDWFFRREAFPDFQDNTGLYLQRCFPRNVDEMRLLKDMIDKKRSKLEEFMDELISLYRLDKVQMVGFTSMFMQNTSSFAMARKLKDRNPKVLTVMGGANCEFPMGEVIAKQIKDIDFTFSGPALTSFPQFVQYCLDGNISMCHSMRGVFSKQTMPKSGVQTIGEDLDIDTPIELDYESFIRRLERYFPGSGIKPVLPFETSRGCWWGERAHCTFCGLNGVSMGYRAMKPELAVQQFKSLFRYSEKVSRLSAVDNILPKTYLHQVLPSLDTPTSMEIFYEVKADLSEQDVSILSDARVKHIQPGIEALATSTLKLMKKGTTVFQNLKLLQFCAMYQIQPHWNLLVGFPGEDGETYARYMDIIPLLFHLNPPSGVFPVRFDRFSPYHKHAEVYGIDLHPMDFYSLVYPFSESDFKNFAYYFTDRNISARYMVSMAEWIDRIRNGVDAWRARWDDSSRASPRLEFIENSAIVYDSRSEVVEHAIGEIGRSILNRLSEPTRIQDLNREFSAHDGIDVLRELKTLKEKKLVFQEGDRMLSLVLCEPRRAKKSTVPNFSPDPNRSDGLVQIEAIASRR
jgi:ribosomal peptide maturation radical SAM protein 1